MKNILLTWKSVSWDLKKNDIGDGIQLEILRNKTDILNETGVLKALGFIKYIYSIVAKKNWFGHLNCCPKLSKFNQILKYGTRKPGLKNVTCTKSNFRDKYQ